MAEKMSKKELKEMRKLEEARRANMDKKANTTKWFVIGITSTLFIGLFLFLVIYLRGNNPALNSTSPAGGPVELTNSGEFRVAEESETPAEEREVILTEFADLQCPACQQYHPIVKSVLDLYPENVALNFKHFPIASIHPNAVPAAVAAEAAGEQDMFFEMVDLLYERQQAWGSLPNPRDQFISYAEELGLDVDQFTAGLDNEEFAEKIEAQRSEGINAGVNSTPSFFVNGVKIQNPADISGFQAAIDEALAESDAPTEAPADPASPSAEETSNPQLDL